MPVTCIKLASFFVANISKYNKQISGAPPGLLSIAPHPTCWKLHFLFIHFSCYSIYRGEEEKENPKGIFTAPFTDFKIFINYYCFFFAADIIYLTFKDKLSSDLKITVIDVGQGNSTLVRFPGGKNMLIDGGGFSDSSFDIGKSVLAPFLYHERISNIDTVVLSHPHPDHLLGLIYIMNNFAVRQVWRSNLPIDLEDYPEWEKAIKLNNINVYLWFPINLRKKYLTVSGLMFYGRQIIPSKDLNNLSYDEVNDSSLVLKITFGKINFLIPGDISSDIEMQLIKSKADLQSDVLVVPHHGSVYSSSAEFIKAVACRYAIVSAGKSNVFHHPHPSGSSKI